MRTPVLRLIRRRPQPAPTTTRRDRSSILYRRKNQDPSLRLMTTQRLNQDNQHPKINNQQILLHVSVTPW